MHLVIIETLASAIKLWIAVEINEQLFLGSFVWYETSIIFLDSNIVHIWFEMVIREEGVTPTRKLAQLIRWKSQYIRIFEAFNQIMKLRVTFLIIFSIPW